MRRVADAQLRGGAGPLRARVYWPAGEERDEAPPLIVFFYAGGLHHGGVEAADGLCRGLCSQTGMVVLALPWQVGLRDATLAMEWAADHGADLDADPGRLLIAGEGGGGDIVTALACHARDERWPVISRHVLISPDLSHSAARSMKGVAPAIVITLENDPLGDDGRRYAGRLRSAGVPVEELRSSEPACLLTELAGVIRTDEFPADSQS